MTLCRASVRSCYEINYTDCENAAVPGYGEAF